MGRGCQARAEGFRRWREESPAEAYRCGLPGLNAVRDMSPVFATRSGIEPFLVALIPLPASAGRPPGFLWQRGRRRLKHTDATGRPDRRMSSTLYKMREYPGAPTPCCRMAGSTPTISQRGQRCPLQVTVAPSWHPFKVSSAHPRGVKSSACSSEPCWPAHGEPSPQPLDQVRGRL